MKALKFNLLGGIILLSLSMMFTSCEGALDDVFGEWDKPAPSTVTPTSVAVTGISIAPTTLALKIGETGQLTATVAPDNATDKTITWSSDNTTAATVDENGLVTAKAEGTATITAAAKDGSDIKGTCTVTVSVPGLLAGKFSVSTTKQVRFSQGNLQAVFASAGSDCTWQFATNQWDFIGGTSDPADANATTNNKINGNGTVSAAGTVDLFGWVGVSGALTSDPAKYGISNSTTESDYGANPNTDNLKSDWGTLAITNGGDAPDYGWRTLTKDEWIYVLKTRESGNTISGTDNARFAKAKLFNTTHGLIIFPDNYTHPDGVADPTGINKTDNTSWNANQYTTADWDKMATAGCVFLPAAGQRVGASVTETDGAGRYWSSTHNNWDDSRVMNFHGTEVNPEGGIINRKTGCSVRLVQDVH
jgi:hypothetical protein